MMNMEEINCIPHASPLQQMRKRTLNTSAVLLDRMPAVKISRLSSNECRLTNETNGLSPAEMVIQPEWSNGDMLNDSETNIVMPFDQQLPEGENNDAYCRRISARDRKKTAFFTPESASIDCWKQKWEGGGGGGRGPKLTNRYSQSKIFENTKRVLHFDAPPTVSLDDNDVEQEPSDSSSNSAEVSLKEERSPLLKQMLMVEAREEVRKGLIY